MSPEDKIFAYLSMASDAAIVAVYPAAFNRPIDSCFFTLLSLCLLLLARETYRKWWY